MNWIDNTAREMNVGSLAAKALPPIKVVTRRTLIGGYQDDKD
jgi:hypothetical protein